MIQLAFKEDKKLKHRGQAAKDLEEFLDSVCRFVKDHLHGDPNFDFLDPKRLVRRLRKEKYRLVGIVCEFQFGLKDMRSLAVKDAAETNILRICKLTETYLKQKLGIAATLNRLIKDAFRNNVGKRSRTGVDWHHQWIQWLNIPKASNYASHRDDNKIRNILNAQDDSALKAFKLLSLVRNFTAHIYNEKSILFKRYDECFGLCLKALMYTIHYVS